MKPKRGERSDLKAAAAIWAAGWKIILSPERSTGRYVAEKREYEDDGESVTRKFESDYTLSGLARIVQRREREEAS